MNLIDALKVNGKAKLCGIGGYVSNVAGFLKWTAPDDSYNGNTVCYNNIIKTDWQPYKEKKKVVIEGVTWGISTQTLLQPFSGRKDFNDADKNELLNKPKMKMTLEWEE